ncbi:hypothetical protein ACFLY7_00710 [Patescibacteria group bacterium]
MGIISTENPIVFSSYTKKRDLVKETGEGKISKRKDTTRKATRNEISRKCNIRI